MIQIEQRNCYLEGEKLGFAIFQCSHSCWMKYVWWKLFLYILAAGNKQPVNFFNIRSKVFLKTRTKLYMKEAHKNEKGSQMLFNLFNAT